MIDYGMRKKIKYQQEESNGVNCVDCGGHLCKNSLGEMSCTDCGLVNKFSNISEGKDWRSFDMTDENKKSRCGPPSNIYLIDGGLSTVISKDDTDYNGNYIKSRDFFNRARKLDIRSSNYINHVQNYKMAVNDLNHLCSEQMFNLSQTTQERVLTLYKKILLSKETKGYNITNILLVLIYRACLEHNNIKTYNEIKEKGNITQREFNRYKKIIYNFFSFDEISLKPSDYLPLMFTKLEIDDIRLFILAKKICDIFYEYTKHDFRITTGKNTTGYTGGALYLACKLMKYNRTQKDIGHAVSCTEITIRHRYRDILTLLYKLFSHDKFKPLYDKHMKQNKLPIHIIFNIIS